jgi:choline dehydrogenase-like flavoprotein
MTFVRAQKTQIDSWEDIGNQGWNWESLFPYYKKSEHFDVPTTAQRAAGASYTAPDHGVDGPLRVGYPFELQNGSLHDQVEQAWSVLGMPHNVDVNGGNVRGFTVWQSTVDREANVREDASRAYYYPIKNRSNLYLYLNTTVNRITWADDTAPVARGVEITSSNGSIGYLDARREVIVSAGALRSPAILELSGIGNPQYAFLRETCITLMMIGS